MKVVIKIVIKIKIMINKTNSKEKKETLTWTRKSSDKYAQKKLKTTTERKKTVGYIRYHDLYPRNG